jgi:hypothetical protein
MPNPLPRWGIFNDVTNTVEETFLGGRIEYTVTASGGAIQTADYFVLLALPEDAVRVALNCAWEHVVTTTNPAFSDASTSHSVTNQAVVVTRVGRPSGPATVRISRPSRPRPKPPTAVGKCSPARRR